MVTKTNVKITPDWDSDGFLIITNASTLKRYEELEDSKQSIRFEDFNMFCAFTDEQFNLGLRSIRSLNDGEKIRSLGAGVFGTKDGIDRFFKAQRKTDDIIAEECNPQEVYYYEYNNYESCINFDGDLDAIRKVASIWGWEVARTINRLSTCYTIDEIIAMK